MDCLISDRLRKIRQVPLYATRQVLDLFNHADVADTKRFAVGSQRNRDCILSGKRNGGRLCCRGRKHYLRFDYLLKPCIKFVLPSSELLGVQYQCYLASALLTQERNKSKNIPQVQGLGPAIKIVNTHDLVLNEREVKRARLREHLTHPGQRASQFRKFLCTSSESFGPCLPPLGKAGAFLIEPLHVFEQGRLHIVQGIKPEQRHIRVSRETQISRFPKVVQHRAPEECLSDAPCASDAKDRWFVPFEEPDDFCPSSFDRTRHLYMPMARSAWSVP